MKYTIRRQPDSAWAIWRPGMFTEPHRSLKPFGTADTFAAALQRVHDDTIKAMCEFVDLTGGNNIDLVEAAYWWAARTRNDWRDRFFNRTNRT